MLHVAVALLLTTVAPFLGDWTGTLEYRDFSSDRTVVLPTTLAITERDGAAHFAYTYDDGPGKRVHADDTVALDPVAGTVRVRSGTNDDTYRSGALAAFLQRGHGTIALAGTGNDNGRTVEVRESIGLEPTALVLRREVRPPGGAFFTRHVYRLTRSVAAGTFRPDAAIVRDAFTAIHPGLARYLTSEQRAVAFDRLDADLANATTVAQAYVALATFTATIRCSHTYPNFSNQSDTLATALLGGRNRLPFYFTWLDGRMIVTRNFSGDASLAPGTEVLRIDGHTAQDIVARLLPLARADGSNDAMRIDELGLSGNARTEPFDAYYPLVFSAGSRFDLDVRSFGAPRERAIRVAALSDADRAAQAARPADPAAPLWTFRMVNANAGYLRMPTWETYGSRWDGRAFVADMFAQLTRARVANLIVDLRGNAGGLAAGTDLLAHLIDAPLPMDGMRRLVRYRTLPPQFAPFVTTWDPSFRDWGTEAQPFDGDFLQLIGDGSGEAAIAPQMPRYRGRVWVLVDGANASATFQFAQVVQQRHLGTLVGTPTGGNLRGINGGAFFFVHLPATGIEVDLPLIGTFPLAPAPDAGLTPDIIRPVTQDDIAAGRDSALAAILTRVRP